VTRLVAVLLNLPLCQLLSGNSGRITSKPEVILSVQTVRPSTVLRPSAYPVSPTLGLRLERLLEVFGVNSGLSSLEAGFLVLQYYFPRGEIAVSLSLYQEWRRFWPSGNRATDKATVLTFERRDTACRGQNPP
jgi:hypothetical protein